MSAFVNIDAQRIPVALSHQPYEVVIGGEGLRGVGKELRRAGLKEGIKVLVVSNADVAEPYSKLFIQNIEDYGYEPKLLILKAGENQKTTESIALIPL